MNILVTGASGFVGSAVIRHLRANGTHSARTSSMRLGHETDWSDDLNDIDTVIHCAARVHVMHDKATDPLTEYRTVNVGGTLALARQAAAMGTKRFVFLSSIKVNGEETLPGKAFTADDMPNPQDAYGISKREAEDALLSIARDTGMEVVIIRPPLVYGSGVKGNFALVKKLASIGIPLPLGSIQNIRSFVSLDNLVDLISVCLNHPAAANQIFLVSDGVGISTPELFRSVATAQGTTVRLLPFPPAVLYFIARILGQAGVARRLCGSLQLDITKTTQVLGWQPSCGQEGHLATFIGER